MYLFAFNINEREEKLMHIWRTLFSLCPFHCVHQLTNTNHWVNQISKNRQQLRWNIGSSQAGPPENSLKELKSFDDR